MGTIMATIFQTIILSMLILSFPRMNVILDFICMGSVGLLGARR